MNLRYKPDCRGYEEVVYFTAAENDVTNVPTAEEQNKNVVDQSILQKGLIITNDLFIQQTESQTIGSDVVFIRYNQLRLLDWKHAPDEVSNSLEGEFI